MRKVGIFALSLLGLFDSAYLWWAYTSASHPMVCLGSGCDVVRASSYAHLWGLPLPVYGAAMYAALAILIFDQSFLPAPLERVLGFAVAGISGAGFLVSLYLTGLEAFVIHAWCAWCVASALTVTLIFALALADLARPAPHFRFTALRGDQAVALPALLTHIIVFGVAVVIGVPTFLLLSRRGETLQVSPLSPQTLNDRLVRRDSHIAGNPASSVTMVEFADFQCPYCGQAEPTVREIRRKFGNEIRFVFRHFPELGLHPQAEKAAEASECAAEQNKFWEAAEKFYDNQNDLSGPALERYAQEIGLDSSRFRQCLSSGRMAPRVKEDVDDARALGIRATPSFIIGDWIIQGSMEFTKFAELIHQQLAQRDSAPLRPARSSGDLSPTSTPSSQSAPARSAPAARHTNASSSPLENAAPDMDGGSILGKSGFSQFQTSALACSEEEAKKQQPVLIRTPEASQLFKHQPKPLFVDVRAPKDFATERIQGALNLPVDQIEQRLGELPKNQDIVFYESGTSPGDVCASGRAAGRVLLAHGFPGNQVKVYQDGLAGWKKEGLPIEH